MHTRTACVAFLNPSLHRCPLPPPADSPLVEGERAVLAEHGDGAVEDAAIDAGARVHEARLDDVDGRRDHRGDETRAERRHEVTREVV